MGDELVEEIGGPARHVTEIEGGLRRWSPLPDEMFHPPTRQAEQAEEEGPTLQAEQVGEEGPTLQVEQVEEEGPTLQSE